MGLASIILLSLNSPHSSPVNSSVLAVSNCATWDLLGSAPFRCLLLLLLLQFQPSQSPLRHQCRQCPSSLYTDKPSNSEVSTGGGGNLVFPRGLRGVVLCCVVLRRSARLGWRVGWSKTRILSAERVTLRLGFDRWLLIGLRVHQWMDCWTTIN